MKKQNNPSIRAHLLWSALILLSLVAICAIPFALGQRTHRDERALQGKRGISKSSPEGIPCTPGWSAGGNLPTVGVRFVGVYFPANGKFYAMGGRATAAENPLGNFTSPFEYDTKIGRAHV